MKIEDFYQMIKNKELSLNSKSSFIQDLNEIREYDRVLKRMAEDFLGAAENQNDKVRMLI